MYVIAVNVANILHATVNRVMEWSIHTNIIISVVIMICVRIVHNIVNWHSLLIITISTNNIIMIVICHIRIHSIVVVVIEVMRLLRLRLQYSIR